MSPKDLEKMINEVKKPKKLTYNLIPHKEHPGMFWIKFSDGVISDDFYNKARANYYGKVLCENNTHLNEWNAQQMPLEAHTEV